MDPLTTFDHKLSILFKDFSDLAHELDFETICELDNEHIIEAQQYPGIYMIEIKVLGKYASFEDWATWFCSEWGKPEYMRMHVPNPKKKRLAAHSQLAEWVPLYIGKSKNIASRVLEHLNLGLEKRTTGMKIKRRTNMANQCFRLSTIKVEVENYGLIMPTLETMLRNKHNPILGRQ